MIIGVVIILEINSVFRVVLASGFETVRDD